MKCEFESRKDYIIVRLEGSLDSEGAADVEKQFNKLAGFAVKNIIVDMSSVDFISSVGIGLILSHAKSCRGRGGKFMIFGIQDKVREILQTANILKLLKVENNLDDCVSAIPG
jgi:stage II sporulation protein AA (anti-sigma F factor antagonist)